MVTHPRIAILAHNGHRTSAACDRLEMIVGRSPVREIPVDDPRVSRAHLKILREPDGSLAVVDLFSANGTVRGGSRLPPGQRVPWLPGETLRIGDTQLTLQEIAEPQDDVGPPDLFAVDDADELDTLFAEVFAPETLAELEAAADLPIDQALAFDSVEEMITTARQIQELQEELEGAGGELSAVRLIAVYALALAVAEGITSLVNPLLGLALYAGLWIALLWYVAARWNRSAQRYLLALGLLPLTRLVSLSLPLDETPQVYWFVIIGVPLLGAALLLKSALSLTHADVGLRLTAPLAQLAVGLSGLGIGYAQYVLFPQPPLIARLSWQTAWLPGLILLVFTGLVEELIFRGVMQGALGKVTGGLSVLLGAALYALLQVGNASPLLIVFVFATALYYGWAVWRTGSLVGVAFAHGLANVLLLLFLPFQA